MASDLSDLEVKASAGGAFTREDAERVLASADLIGVGMLGETSRTRRSGAEMRFGRVCEVPVAGGVATRGEAGEVRLVGKVASIDSACVRVREAALWAEGVPLTGFSAADLLDLCGSDHLALADCAAQLHAAGLEAVAECPIDQLGDLDHAVEVIRAMRHGGLGVWRLTVDRAPLDLRLDLVMSAERLQEEAGGILAFAPLPRRDPVDTPSTGYDDVRTVALAALLCRDIAWIQVDWSLYGPKLAQVALAYGANDLDNVAAVDTLNLGPRRSPREDILRQIRAAGGTPVERNGRYERRS